MTARLLISASLLAYCLSFIDTDALWQVIESINLGYLLAAICLVLLNTVWGALRFKILFDAIHVIPYIVHIRFYFCASFFNQLLPTSIGGDALRVIWLARFHTPLATRITGILLERILGVATLLIILLVCVAIQTPPRALEPSLQVLLYAMMSLAPIILILVILRGHISFISRTVLPAGLISSLKLYLDRLGTVIFATFIYQTMTIAVTVTITMGLGISLPISAWCVVVPMVWLATLLPVSIGGLGVRELAFVLFAGAYGMTAEASIAISLLTFIAFFVGGLIGGLWYVFSPELD